MKSPEPARQLYKIIYQETCGDAFHYRVAWWRDFVPRLDRAGAKRARGTIVDLIPHPNASIFDHEFMSPTYQERLKWHITNYIQTQGKML